MEFGRVPVRNLAKINFTLPADPIINFKVLKGKKAVKTIAYVGCAKWGRKEWLGKIYPVDTKEKHFLEHYVKQYNSIEMNATHYKVYEADKISLWSEKASGMNFKFCPKMAKAITHYGTLENKQELLDKFFEGIVGFGKQLGPIFIQVSDKFSPKRKYELFNFLKILPKDVHFFLEVRHPGWFEPIESKLLFDTLKKLRVGAVITDTSGRRDCCHMHLTMPKTFIRFVGNSLHKSDYIRCDNWVHKIKYWLDNGLKELYFFMHMHDEAKSPELTVYFIKKLNEVCGMDLHVPQFEKKKTKAVSRLNKKPNPVIRLKK